MSRRATFAGATVLSLPAVAWFAERVAETPAVVLVGAVAPALGWTALIACLGRVRPWLVATLFFWGAVIAACAAQTATDHGLVTPLVGGPILEEIAKAAVLVALARVGDGTLRDVRSGIACGALVGMGFAMSENFGYLLLAAVQGGSPGLIRGVYLRALLGGLSHAIFTATTGAGLAWGRLRATGPTVPLLGLGAAILQHVVWNAVAAATLTSVVCNAVDAGAPCREAPSAFGLFVVAPAITIAVLGPGLVALLALARRCPPSGSSLSHS